MLSRRGFIGTLLASVGALTVDPQTLLWRPPSEALALPEAIPTACLTMQQITLAVMRQLRADLDLSRGVPLMLGDSKIGHSIYPDPGNVLNHQFSVMCGVPETLHETGLDVDRYIKPCAKALAMRIKHGQLKGFGELPLSLSGEYQAARATDPQSGVSVRGILAYAPGWDEQIRFDVLVAA